MSARRYVVRSTKQSLVFEVATAAVDNLMPIERAIRLAKQDPRIGEILEITMEGAEA